MRKLLWICVVATLPTSCDARPLGKFWHFVSTHKELIISDAVVIAAWSADAASTVNDQRNCPSCVETNPLLGPHPSRHAIWLTASGSASLQTGLDHLLWRYAPNPVYRHMVWIPTAIIGLTETNNVWGNAQAAQASSRTAGRFSTSQATMFDEDNKFSAPVYRRSR
jgi:hypothetical protein